MTEDEMFAYAMLAWCFLMVGTLLTVTWHLAQGTPTRRAETTGSVGEADGGPVGSADAPVSQAQATSGSAEHGS